MMLKPGLPVTRGKAMRSLTTAYQAVGKILAVLFLGSFLLTPGWATAQETPDEYVPRAKGETQLRFASDAPSEPIPYRALGTHLQERLAMIYTNEDPHAVTFELRAVYASAGGGRVEAFTSEPFTVEPGKTVFGEDWVFRDAFIGHPETGGLWIVPGYTWHSRCTSLERAVLESARRTESPAVGFVVSPFNSKAAEVIDASCLGLTITGWGDVGSAP